jgi:hypothetical protein
MNDFPPFSNDVHTGGSFAMIYSYRASLQSMAFRRLVPTSIAAATRPALSIIVFTPESSADTNPGFTG